MRVVLRRVRVERAETPGEVDLLLRRQALIPEHEYKVVQVRPVHVREGDFVERP